MNVDHKGPIMFNKHAHKRASTSILNCDRYYLWQSAQIDRINFIIHSHLCAVLHAFLNGMCFQMKKVVLGENSENVPEKPKLIPKDEQLNGF